MIVQKREPAAGKLYRLMLFSSFAVAIYAAGIAAAYAQVGVMSVPGNILCYILAIIYGNLGRAIATIGVIMIGLGALFGKVTWGMAIIVTIGISVVFASSVLVSDVISTMPTGFGAAICAGSNGVP
ncbi:MAG: TrbC/VirB2 family protein [Pseudomonadota bacterium]|nr:TrbC/VirB2 family protein [Pseudomonadota bacterium]MDE3037064.1 TrbC/VirB2 family protein [Pseudomonadota bacterium]